MTYPKCYDPEYGYKYQLIIRYSAISREWEHLDYAKDKADKDYLIDNYILANRNNGAEIKAIRLPQKYWIKT